MAVVEYFGDDGHHVFNLWCQALAIYHHILTPMTSWAETQPGPAFVFGYPSRKPGACSTPGESCLREKERRKGEK
ncbi:uncharacterized [Tachysurus ichikawai]